MRTLIHHILLKFLYIKSQSRDTSPAFDLSYLENILLSDYIKFPPTLRRFIRILSKQKISIPEILRWKGAWGLIGAALLYGLILGGHANAIVGYTTAFVGLQIQEVKISGQIEAPESEIIRKLALGDHAASILFDPRKARMQLKTIPWIEEARIRKTYPGHLEVEIEEYQPLALWQIGHEAFIIDKNGQKIEPFHGTKFSSLILLIGEGANTSGPDFLKLLNDFAELKSKIRTVVLVSNRRWNLILENGIEIKLPEVNPAAALEYLSAAQAEHNLFERQIATIDLRIKGQMSVGLSGIAMKEHQKIYREQLKRLKSEARAL